MRGDQYSRYIHRHQKVFDYSSQIGEDAQLYVSHCEDLQHS